jgi:hypothetical protein
LNRNSKFELTSFLAGRSPAFGLEWIGVPGLSVQNSFSPEEEEEEEEEEEGCLFLECCDVQVRHGEDREGKDEKRLN